MQDVAPSDTTQTVCNACVEKWLRKECGGENVSESDTSCRSRSEEERRVPIAELLEVACNEVCDKLCKYRETIDADAVCDYRRQNKRCPIDNLI